MKRATEQKILEALDGLADGLHEIGTLGILELRFKFKGVLERVEKKVQAAAEALERDLGGP